VVMRASFAGCSGERVTREKPSPLGHFHQHRPVDLLTPRGSCGCQTRRTIDGRVGTCGRIRFSRPTREHGAATFGSRTIAPWWLGSCRAPVDPKAVVED